MTSVRFLRPRLCELWPLPGIDAPRESGPVTLRSVALAMRPILPSTRCSLTRHGRVRTRPGHRALGCAGSGDRPALTRVRTAAISAAAARAMEQRAFISCDWNGRPRRRARRRSACPRRRLSDAARVATDVMRVPRLEHEQATSCVGLRQTECREHRRRSASGNARSFFDA